MKFSARLSLFSLCVGFWLCATAPSAWAVRSIDTPVATQDVVFAGTPTMVTVTAQVAVDPNLLPASLNLVRVNSQGQGIAVLSSMYDDGTNGGDQIRGDGTFTATILINQANPGSFAVAASAAYRGSIRRVLSPSITITVAHEPTEADIETMLAVTDAGTAFWANHTGDDDAARAALIAFLKAQTGVANVVVAPDGVTIWITFTSGLESGISTNPVGTKGALSRVMPSVYATNLGPLLATLQTRAANMEMLLASAVGQASQIIPTGNAKSIALAPFYSDFTPFDETDNVANSLTQTCGGAPLILKNASGDVNAFKNLRAYGVISISSHGDLHSSGDVVILTRERATLTSTLAHLGDWVTNRIRNVSGYWAITPAFVATYAGRGYPSSLVYVSACESTHNDTMANAFLNNGAKTYFGYSRVVNSGFSFNEGTSLFTKLCDQTLSPEDRTTQKAYDFAGPNYTDPNPPNAVFQMRGSPNLHIPGELVVNGGFESGDLLGWVPDTTFGYVKAVTEDQSEGHYSARIGRWDQPYSGFGGFRGPYVPGVEPSGADTLYQDIQIPTMVSSVMLTFSYNVVTYDGANYDWLDMRVVDADTGAVLLQPVSDIGGIIAGSPANWGLFYTTGWQTVAQDLTAFAGKRIRLLFSVQQDGYGDQIAAYIDGVSVKCTP
jgi:hypothetical protein